MQSEVDRWKSQQARAWLDEVRASVLRTDAACDRLKEARAAVDGLHAASCERRRGSATDGTEAMMKAMERVAKAEADVCEAIEEYVELQREATNVLFSIECPGWDVLLYYFAMGARTWEEAGKRAGYTLSGAHSAVYRVLPLVYDAMPHRYRDPLPSAL